MIPPFFPFSKFFIALFTSDCVDRILRRLSPVIVSALNGTDTQRKLIPHVLFDLVDLENRPDYLMGMAYSWCSTICENRQSFKYWERLLLVCLEIGFRHVDVQTRYGGTWLVHTEHHRKLVDVVFESQKSEAIAELLCAWTIGHTLLEPEHALLLKSCTEHLADLLNLVPFSPRLRRAIIRFVELIGYKGLEAVGVEASIRLLNHLHVKVEDMYSGSEWAKLLLATLQSPEAVQRSSNRYWELLVELPTFNVMREWLEDLPIYSPRTTTHLIDAQEWDKLECWMGIVWMLWPPGAGGIAEDDLDRSMLLLFRQRPGAYQKLEQRVGRWNQILHKDVPESFQPICKRASEATQQDIL